MLVRIDNTVTVPGVTAANAEYNASRQKKGSATHCQAASGAFFSRRSLIPAVLSVKSAS
jgi:hypothetical protein